MIRSRGAVTRLSTWPAEAPGYWTKISIIGTEIWGSSCRGVNKSPMRPMHRAPISSIGVTGVLMKARAMRPASPSLGWLSAPRARSEASSPGGLLSFSAMDVTSPAPPTAVQPCQQPPNRTGNDRPVRRRRPCTPGLQTYAAGLPASAPGRGAARWVRATAAQGHRVTSCTGSSSSSPGSLPRRAFESSLQIPDPQVVRRGNLIRGKPRHQNQGGKWRSEPGAKKAVAPNISIR
jgi:hypothetical protein